MRLPAFEGPLDLLLHLIKKSEISITDIPINVITKQYLEYLDLMQSLNLGVAGEYLVMAATLVHIKSRELLPPAETPGEEEQDDPRAALVTRLIEYQRFKEAALDLEARERLWRDLVRRPPLESPEPQEQDVAVGEISLFDLLDALRSVLERTPESRGLELVVDELTVQDRMNAIMDRLQTAESVTFGMLFETDRTRASVIVTFLALLELARLRLIRVVQAEVFGAIRLWKTESLKAS